MMPQLSPSERAILDAFEERRPDLRRCVDSMLQAHGALVASFEAGGKLLLCGNGGSFADAMHIAGELCKSFRAKRPLPAGLAASLSGLPYGEDLGAHLEAGLPAVTLGLNGSLKTAVENDSPLRDMAFAQETCALIRKDDCLLAISTSGNALNCTMALSVARASGAATIALTGPCGGTMVQNADISIKAPGASTPEIQEAHVVLYHALCLLVESHFFPESA